jgi:hypothetical protein
MKLNGIKFNNTDNLKDHTKELLEEMTEANKHYNIKIIWED